MPLPVSLSEPPSLVRQGVEGGRATSAPAIACPAEQQSRPWPGPVAGQAPGEGPPPQPGLQRRVGFPDQPASEASQGSAGPTSAPGGTDYHLRLKPTAAGWPVRALWCVWIEPLPSGAPASPFQLRWQRAVQAALATWQAELPLTQVPSADQAQVRLWRRTPPLEAGADGALRASHGRALLTLRQVQRQGQWQLEPLVEVLISPGQRPEAIQATSLHELGHAFGLWGHSDQAGDVMAASPTAKPVLALSQRDRATLGWLRAQPGLAP